ncbi:thioredoxin fold domain-containing protein [Burkholderia aenigmatica]|uniref:thioredoxin fold domain-containing protein n=1 Tax=Burkholderia aenigmatica TaxID=2015348 RepID=UPI001F3E740C|nr:thioredoxin fold domain-containing protein [Burkholderia aenigmatica]UKD17172.1 thioredoxin fold domain-containing protein [Burkholderia aenigmatica]
MFRRPLLTLFAAALAALPLLSAHAQIPPDVRARYEATTNRFSHPDGLRPEADQAYTGTAFPGIYAIRVSKAGSAPPPLVGMPVMFFDSDASWLLTPLGDDTSNPYYQQWRVANVKHWKGWEHVAQDSPLVQQLLRSMPVDKLVHQGADAPVFVYLAAPDCPYCRRDQAAMESSPYSFAILPITLDPTRMPVVEHLACADDPLGDWNKLMRTGRGSTAPCSRFDRAAWWDLKQLFFPRSATPAFLFADGTVIRGDVDAAMRKAADMKARGLVFQ